MRTAALVFLFAAAGLAAADKVRFNSESLVDRKERLEWEANQKAAQESIMSRCRGGLLVSRLQYSRDGWAYVTVTNTTPSTTTFDFRQLRAIELETGNIVEPLDLKLNPREIANYEVAPRSDRVFNIRFPGRCVVGVNWKDVEVWQFEARTNIAPSKDPGEAMARLKKAFVEERIARKKRALEPVDGQVVSK